MARQFKSNFLESLRRKRMEPLPTVGQLACVHKRSSFRSSPFIISPFPPTVFFYEFRFFYLSSIRRVIRVPLAGSFTVTRGDSRRQIRGRKSFIILFTGYVDVNPDAWPRDDRSWTVAVDNFRN